MSPRVIYFGEFRIHFYSSEEPRMHVHVDGPSGSAKFWIEPSVQLARSNGIPPAVLRRIRRFVVAHEQEIREVWYEHFGR